MVALFHAQLTNHTANTFIFCARRIECHSNSSGFGRCDDSCREIKLQDLDQFFAFWNSTSFSLSHVFYDSYAATTGREIYYVLFLHWKKNHCGYFTPFFSHRSGLPWRSLEAKRGKKLAYNFFVGTASVQQIMLNFTRCESQWWLTHGNKMLNARRNKGIAEHARPSILAAQKY